MAQLVFNSKKYYLQRYPKTNDKSLRAWSNAELLALEYLQGKTQTHIHTFNDRFGVWNCTLSHKNITTIWAYASQKKAICQNLKNNNFSTDVHFKTPLENLTSVNLALIKIPKSLELFELFLQQIYKASTEKTEVVCCFMTKYFSNSYLKIASEYFEGITQSKAWKKARLLVLTNPKKEIKPLKNSNSIQWKNYRLQQYYGVFSSDKIDIGTQFLIQHLTIKKEENNILDVASGNGIIAFEVAQQNPNANITLVDDFNLAIESSKLNLKNYTASFICNNTLQTLPNNTFDLAVSNPPFHFEHENNIEISLTLFKEIQNVLKPNGRFILVANKHLNYKTHLTKLFLSVKEISVNNKFVVYECSTCL